MRPRHVVVWKRIRRCREFGSKCPRTRAQPSEGDGNVRGPLIEVQCAVEDQRPAIADPSRSRGIPGRARPDLKTGGHR